MNLDTLIVLSILIVEIVDFIFTRWEFWMEYRFDKGLVEKKRKAVTAKEVVLAPLPEAQAKPEEKK